MLLDLQYNTIRIHRNTLSYLGNPKFIQFMINPNTNEIIIKKCNSNDIGSERIRWEVLNENNKSCEFYSKSLIKLIRTVFYNDQDTNKYCFTGRYINAENLAIFDIITHKNLTDCEVTN